ncbi:DUF4091 domain-containing protein [Gleimia sp. 6138-11-ORH1]|uniref:DUF4091 domain-containing protein n=1 Tax=Gleimia sp. 6138-11-ORH1 TaxID=2973937 RepID=UPI0021674A5E|nr:DUF4091 domain-containing protein [Gleimia sp. 6138-11-ORH1]MCS4484903.1 DUF4091 domain-containing protein [Gleimia sp. 6138-11-ORH1]
MFELKLVNALDKVLPHREPIPLVTTAAEVKLKALQTQTTSVQLAFKTSNLNELATFNFESEKVSFSTYKVGLVPVQNPAPLHPDDAYLLTTPGLMPDPLYPLGEFQAAGSVTLKAGHTGWNSIWIDLVAPPGKHLINFSVSAPYQQNRSTARTASKEAPPVYETQLELEVLETQLPAAQIVNTQWFHADSLANYYEVEVWSEAHWQVIDAQFASAAKMGVNCLLMPLWTPPLDTAVGTYRTTVQLLEISEAAGEYSFDFTRAEKWLELMRRHGIKQVEVPHLFTQWGAAATPRFLITDATGKQTYRFGWEEPASSPEYRKFLTQLIPAVRSFFSAELGEENTWYHISDEPTKEQLNAYQKAKTQVFDLLAGTQIIDALSEPELLAAVEKPVVATDAVDKFRKVQVEPEWVYNCVAQATSVANRFMAQRGTRHREIGFQLYKGKAKGFLHWAFNFYNSQYSLGSVDPYQDTAAGGGFISGDAFVVYPGKNGEVVESLRHRLLRAAIDDLALCQLVEKRYGRETVLKAIDPQGTIDYNCGYRNSVEIDEARAALLELLSGSERP